MSRTSSPFFLDPIAMPLAILYGGIVNFRNHAYDSELFRSDRVSVPVVSIGGITAGGAGKTPLAMWTLDRLLEIGAKPGLLSRGYNRKSKQLFWVSRGDDTPIAASQLAGDEPCMIANRFRNIPVLCDSNRVRGAKALIAESKCNVIVLDDGFQHRKLVRDLDWISFDTGLSRRSYRMLPWGYLREGFANIHRAHLLWLKVSDTEHATKWEKAIRNLGFDKPIVPFAFSPSAWLSGDNRLPLEALSGKRCIGFAGIAHPSRFLDSLRSTGIEVVQFLSFPDHHDYSPNDLARITRLLHSEHADLIVTTEKDLVKLPPELRSNQLYVLRSDIQILGSDIDPRKQLTELVRKS